MKAEWDGGCSKERERFIRYALEELPSAQPTYTDEEIQKMQDLEQAQIEKAYQLGYEDGYDKGYDKGYDIGRSELREEQWEDGRDRLD